MKKLGIALLTAMTISAPAFAADMAARPVKAPLAPPPPVATWTGCYIGAGGGGTYAVKENRQQTVAGTLITQQATFGSSGWFGTVQAGCDYQFNNFVVGAFGDYDFSDIHGDRTIVPISAVGRDKKDWGWSAGARIGYVVFPQLLTYVSGGFTQGHWAGFQFANAFTGVAINRAEGARTYNGWFIGAGDEYAMSFLPGLFWKTEYRYSDFGTHTDPILTATGATTNFAARDKVFEHSVRSELVYRFNWTGR